jgi:hypothetical protein
VAMAEPFAGLNNSENNVVVVGAMPSLLQEIIYFEVSVKDGHKLMCREVKVRRKKARCGRVADPPRPKLLLPSVSTSRAI